MVTINQTHMLPGTGSGTGSPQLEVRVPKTDLNSQAQYNAIPTYCKYLYAHIMRAQHLGACFLPRCRRSINDDYRHLLYARSAVL